MPSNEGRRGVPLVAQLAGVEDRTDDKVTNISFEQNSEYDQIVLVLTNT